MLSRHWPAPSQICRRRRKAMQKSRPSGDQGSATPWLPPHLPIPFKPTRTGRRAADEGREKRLRDRQAHRVPLRLALLPWVRAAEESVRASGSAALGSRGRRCGGVLCRSVQGRGETCSFSSTWQRGSVELAVHGVSAKGARGGGGLAGGAQCASTVACWQDEIWESARPTGHAEAAGKAGW